MATDVVADDPNEADMRCDLFPGVMPREIGDAHFGERISSLRQLTTRWCPLMYLAVPAGAAATPNHTVTTFEVPMYPKARKPVSATAFSQNVWTWGSFVGQLHGGNRGGVRYRLVHNIPASNRVTIWVVKNERTATAINPWGGAQVANRYDMMLSTKLNSFVFGGSGAMMLESTAPGGLEFEVPNAWGSYVQEAVNTVDTMNNQTFQIFIECDAVNMLNFVGQLWCAMGDDYSPISYCGVPTLTRAAIATYTAGY
jgi:hypothetical protein